MRILSENITGDYAAYNEAAMQPENGHFVFMTAVARASTVQSFLESLTDKGVVFVASESPVDVEFWIAAPRKMVGALHNALQKWHFETGEPIPELKPERRGIFHAIMR